MAGGMSPGRGLGVPIGQRQVAGRHDEPEPTVTTVAYRRLMGLPDPPLSLDRQHVVVETGAGPAAGLLVELDGDRARAMFVEHEDGTLMETWVAVQDVTEVDAPMPSTAT